MLVQRVTKATRLIDRVHRVTRRDFLLHPLHEPRAGELLRQSDGPALALDGRDDVVQVHIQAQREDVARRPHWRIALRAGCD